MGLGKEWVKRNQWRVIRMNCLYFIDQRWRADHKFTHLFTGLNEIDPFQNSQSKNRAALRRAGQRLRSSSLLE